MQVCERSLDCRYVILCVVPILCCALCYVCLTVDEIYHLAAPASPFHYMHNPIKTIKTNAIGTGNMLGMISVIVLHFIFVDYIPCLTLVVGTHYLHQCQHNPCSWMLGTNDSTHQRARSPTHQLADEKS